jgi:hypothetical protein
MSNQIVISSGAKVRNLDGVLTGSTGIVGSVPLGAANGVATLDALGKVPLSQLPASVVTYLGTWNAATNTPTLANGTGDTGDLYICNVAGTVNFGAGPITFSVGDWVIYSGTTWERSAGSTGTVTSVAVTESGDALSITGSPITTAGTINIGFAGTSGQYINGAGGLTTFPSLTGFVPYTGATASVDLGLYSLFANDLFANGNGTNNANLYLKQGTASLLIQNGYSNILATGTKIGFQVATSAIAAYYADFQFSSLTAQRTYTLPDASGTLALTSNLSAYVPYTGATANVNLGTFNLTADVITGATGSFASSGGSDTFAINHSSGSGIALNITKGGNGEGLYINKTSGSGNAATIIGTLNATTLVKSGGTSSQFLKADGSVDSNTYLTTSSAASTYVPYTGATTSLDLGIYNLTSNLQYNKGVIVNKSSTTANSLNIEIAASASISGVGYISLTSIATDSLSIYFGGSTKVATLLGSSLSANRTYTLPDASGTLALTSNLSAYVPYSGATSNVNLGLFGLTSRGLTISKAGSSVNGLVFEQAAGLGIDGAGFTTIGPSGSDGFGFYFGGTTQAFVLKATSITTQRAYTLPDATGTLALTSDLSGYVTLGTAQTISGAKTFSRPLRFANNSPSIDFYAANDSTYYGSLFVNSSFYQFTAAGTADWKFQNQAGNTVFQITQAGVANFFYALNGTTLGLTGALNFTAGANINLGTTDNFALFLRANNTNILTLFPSGNAGINAGGSDTGERFQVTGTTRLNGALSGTSATFSGSISLSSNNIPPTGAGIFQGGNFIQIISGTGGFAVNNNANTIVNLAITNGGNVGIGTSSPSQRLTLVGSSTLGTFAAGTDTTHQLLIGADSSYAEIQAITQGVGFNKNLILQRQGGNVGIGTSSPISFTSYTTTQISNTAGAGLIVESTTGSILGQFFADNGYAGGAAVVFGSRSNHPLTFGTNNTERMRITSTGNVGIGTSSTGFNAAGLPLVVGSGSGNTGLTIFSSATGAGSIHFADAETTGAGSFAGFINYEHTENSMRFGTTGTTPTEHMRITSGGNVGIGTSSPGRKLSIESSDIWMSYKVTGDREYLTGMGTSDAYRIFDNTAGVERMRITSGGAFKATTNGTFYSVGAAYHELRQSNTDTNLAIFSHTAASPYGPEFIFTAASPNNTTNYFLYCTDTTNLKAAIYSNGTFGSRTGTYGSIISDIRYKENIFEATPKLNDIMKLKVVNYNFIDDTSAKQIGFIAQEMEQIFPSLVFKNDTRKYDEDGNVISGYEDSRGLKVGMEFAILVKAIQELKAEIDELKNR